jgi:YfiH family protein
LIRPENRTPTAQKNDEAYSSLPMKLKHPTIPPRSSNSPKINFPPAGQKATTFRFEKLSQFEEIRHEVFTRHGGVSNPPYDTLNVGCGEGDHPENVRANLEIIKTIMDARHLLLMKQVHGNDIYIFRKGRFPTPPSTMTGDAIISDIPSAAVVVKSADCQAIILFDPIKKVISNVHCGWRGNASNIIAGAVARMKSNFQCDPSHIIAGIGPSLGPCCAEFMTYREIFPETFKRFMVRKNFFDLWQISRWQLLEAGLQKKHIEVAGICTRCRTDLFYSYRAEGITGRFATVAMLNENAPLN